MVKNINVVLHIKNIQHEKILKSDLRKNILKHIILTDQPDYQTLSKEVERERITIHQSIESLSKKQCIT